MPKNKKKNSAVDELSEIGIKYAFRLSTPKGYFPEDVDPVIIKKDNLIENLTKETHQLSDKVERLERDNKMLKDELTKIRFEMTMMEVPDTSTSTDFEMLNRLNTINETVGDAHELVTPVETEKEKLDLISGESMTLDSLISEKSQFRKDNSPVKNKTTNKFDSNIFNENGELDII